MTANLVQSDGAVLQSNNRIASSSRGSHRSRFLPWWNRCWFIGWPSAAFGRGSLHSEHSSFPACLIPSSFLVPNLVKTATKSLRAATGGWLKVCFPRSSPHRHGQAQPPSWQQVCVLHGRVIGESFGHGQWMPAGDARSRVVTV